jgi:uncharacterized protein DUF6916
MSTRRELLRLGTLAGVAALVPGAADASRLMIEPRGAVDGPHPTRQQLLAQLNASFYVYRSNYPDLRLVLIAVSDPALSRNKPGRPDCFRALFRGPATSPLAQSTYALLNRLLGEFEIFLVPVGQAAKGQRFYEASFNRTVDPFASGLS